MVRSFYEVRVGCRKSQNWLAYGQQQADVIWTAANVARIALSVNTNFCGTSRQSALRNRYQKEYHHEDAPRKTPPGQRDCLWRSSASSVPATVLFGFGQPAVRSDLAGHEIAEIAAAELPSASIFFKGV